MEMILLSAEEKMEKAVASLEGALKTIRTGRANPAILDRVSVSYYGSEMPLNQLAGISVVEGRQLVVKPYDKSVLKEMERAISMCDLGVAPQNDGDVIRINIPPLTEERRKEFAKDAHKFGEEAKVAIRIARRDANDAIKKNKEFTEDEAKQGQEEVQKLTDRYIKKIDEVVEAKAKEILSI